MHQELVNFLNGFLFHQKILRLLFFIQIKENTLQLPLLYQLDSILFYSLSLMCLQQQDRHLYHFSLKSFYPVNMRRINLLVYHHLTYLPIHTNQFLLKKVLGREIVHFKQYPLILTFLIVLSAIHFHHKHGAILILCLQSLIQNQEPMICV